MVYYNVYVHRNRHGGRDRVHKISKGKEVSRMREISLDDIMDAYDEYAETINSGC